MPADVRPDVRSFFERYDQASDGLDTAVLGDSFQEVFLSLDPGAAQPVSRDALLAALPARGQLFGAIGATGTDLATITESPLDDQHTLVATTWTVRFSDAQAAPLTLRSTFLLRREPGGPWRIAVYLNHQDIVAMIRARVAAAR